MRAGRLLIALLLSGAVSSTAALPVRAEQEMDPQLSTLYDEGLAAGARKDWATAYAKLSRVWERVQNGQVAGVLGQTERNLGMCAAAIAHLDLALKDPPPGPPEAAERAKERIQEWLDDCNHRVGRVRIITSSGVELFVDGVSKGIAPLPAPLILDPTQHVIEARQNGQILATTQFFVEPNSSKEIALQVRPSQYSLPGAVANHRAPPAAGSASLDRSNSHESSKPSLVPVYVLGGIAVGAVIGVGVLAIVRTHQRDDMHDIAARNGPSGCLIESSECDRLANLPTRHNNLATVQDVGVGVSLAAAAGALGYLGWTLLSSHGQEGNLELSVSPSGLSGKGRFW